MIASNDPNSDRLKKGWMGLLEIQHATYEQTFNTLSKTPYC